MFKRLTFIISLLVLTGIVIHRAPSSTGFGRSQSLKQAVASVGEWRNVGEIPLDAAVVDSLDLDDYVNQSYTDGTRTVSLYIGYYFSSKKIGVAHDPLVCFLGQGWVISKRQQGRMSLDDLASMTISYSEMIAERRQDRQFVTYWFQAYEHAIPNTLTQKIVSTWQRATKGRGDSAFVRISMPMGSASEEECRETVHKFIHVFYPLLIRYVQG